MPFSARRRAMIAPPKPLPITMTSKDVGIAGALDRRASAADALFPHPDVCGRIGAVVAPARVVELNDVVTAVPADRFPESQGAEALPVVHRHARQPLDPALPAVV